MIIECPHCQSRLKCSRGCAGKPAGCPQCGGLMRLPFMARRTMRETSGLWTLVNAVIFMIAFCPFMAVLFSFVCVRLLP